MKRLLLMVGLLSLLAVVSACGGDEKEITIPGDGGDVKITAGGELPSDFPDDFPIYEGAKLTGTMTGEQEGQTGYFATWETDASTQEVTDFYKEALDKDPWKTSGVVTTGEGAMITFTRADNEDFGGLVTVSSSDDKTMFVVFVGEGAGAAPTDQVGEEEQPTPEEEATPQEEEPSAQAEVPDEVALPDDYPSDVAPIPDGARVIDASSFTTGGQTSFAVNYLTKDDPEAVADFYGGEVPGNGWSETSRLSSDGEVFLTYENQGEAAQLIFSISPSDDYEGYTEVAIVLTAGQ
jgi:predicted enzyme related to lactoylglutathione lyase